ncbi:MAG: NAD-dependent epimerase/dehydratase family protein [Limisphaerales bacterium]
MKAQKNRFIVTGANGTLGRNLLEKFATWPKTETLALLRVCSEPAKEFERVRYQHVDFLSRKEVATVIKRFQPTSVIHCAASGMRWPRPKWFDLVRFNVDVSLSLCESVSQIPGCQFVYISTGLGYRDQGRSLRESDPLDTEHPYGASKAAADMLMRAAAAEFDVPMVVLRPFSFSGAGDTSTRLFPSLLRAAAAKQPFDLSPGDQVRDHCAVGDVAGGIAQAVLRRQALGRDTHVFNLGSGRTVCLKELIQDVIEQIGLDVRLNFGRRDYARFEPKHLVADITRAKEQLHWEPRTNFAYAIWQLARESFPELTLKKPRILL